jgi:dTDP-4-amino-4,6-dideoxygalactose transaminase
MRVPFLDLPALHAGIDRELDEAIREILATGAFISGPAVERFESAFAVSVDRAHCVGVNSGTSALHLALLASGVGPGDEVVTTPLTWISTSLAVTHCGATPVFADVDACTGALDPNEAEQAVTSRTRALLPVDLYGNPADLRSFEALAARHDVVVVDDACQAHGSRLDGRPVASFGDLACFSFYPGKNLGAAGQGGAVVTDDADVAGHLRRLRDHGQIVRHHHLEPGFNYRMDGLQGAVLDVKLRHLERWNEQRREAALRYGELLRDLGHVGLPTLTPGAETNWHLYVVRVPDRDRVLKMLQHRGVEAGIHYPVPVHLQPAYASLGYQVGDFPHAEQIANECLSLPMFPGITPEQQAFVAETLGAAVEQVA